MSCGSNELGVSCSKWSKMLPCGSVVLCSLARASASPALPVARRLCQLPVGSAKHLKKSACCVPSPVAELGQHANRRVGEKGVTSSKPGGSLLRRGRKRRVPSPPAELAACAQHCSQACLQRFTGHNLLSSKPMANSVLSAADAK